MARPTAVRRAVKKPRTKITLPTPRENRGREGGIRAEASLPFGNGLRMAAARAGYEDPVDTARAQQRALIRSNLGMPLRTRIVPQAEMEREYRASQAHETRLPGETIEEWAYRLTKQRLKNRRPPPIRT